MSRRAVGHGPTPDPGTGGDDSACHVLHVDMDAFYASVELRSRPDLRGAPVIVGGAGSRGVVLSATYEARAFGVRSAMPMTRARRLCPAAVILPPQHELYAEASRGVMAIFTSLTPWVEPLALDEAFLEVGSARRRWGSPRQIGELIRARVADEQGITCSVGVAGSKFVAKLASVRAKPDGLVVVAPEDVITFLHPLPVTALWGVGERTEAVLDQLGLRRIGDLANTPVATLVRALGPAAGQHLHDLSWGRDARAVNPHEPDRSVGAEETFARDVDDPAVVRRELLALSTKTAARMRAAGTVGRTISIKVRFADFTTITRSKTLRDATDVARTVYDTALALYEALGLQRARIRLVGVRVEGLAPLSTTPQQLDFEGRADDWRAAETASDRAVARFGRGAVRPATLVGADRPAPPGRPSVD